jgi:hypothetical protein
MPTGTCHHPDHRTGPSAWPVLALIASIAVAAIVIATWHQVIVAMVIVAVMILAAGAVITLWHRAHHELQPDTDTIITRADIESAVLRGRVDQLEQQQQQRAIEAPAVHNHLHLHGVSRDDIPGVVRQAIGQPQQHR